MSGNSTTYIYALPLDIAQALRDDFLAGADGETGPDIGAGQRPDQPAFVIASTTTSRRRCGR